MPRVTPEPKLILISGSGRSGTSLLSKSLGYLGCTIPGPEVPADQTNPAGFGEPEWLVEFHRSRQAACGIIASDARPNAVHAAVQDSFRTDVIESAKSLLLEHLAGWDGSHNIVLKDPRISWFIHLWSCVAEEVGLELVNVLALRDPLAVVGSKLRWYSDQWPAPYRLAAWVNQFLSCEQISRGTPRVIVNHADLLEDWSTTLFDVDRLLHLDLGRWRDAWQQLEIVNMIDPTRSHSVSVADSGGLDLNAWPVTELAEIAREVFDSSMKASFNASTSRHTPIDTELEAGFFLDRSAEFDGLRERYAVLYRRAQSIVHFEQPASRSSVGSGRATQTRDLQRQVERLEASKERTGVAYASLKVEKNRLHKKNEGLRRERDDLRRERDHLARELGRRGLRARIRRMEGQVRTRLRPVLRTWASRRDRLEP